MLAMSAGFGVAQIVGLLGIGFAAGVVGGLLGVGGGLVMIPALVVVLGERFGPDSFHLFKLASIATSIVLSVPAVVQHARARAPVYPMLSAIVPLALVGVVAGTGLSALFTQEHTHVLRRMFGGFLVLVVAINVYQEQRGGRSAPHEPHWCDSCPMPNRRSLIGTLVGFPAGLTAGLLGIGGGVWAVPVQQLLLGVRVRNAIANSAFMILFVAPATALALSVQVAGLPDLRVRTGWWLALFLAPGALLGGWCGAGLTHRLPVRQLRYAFYLFLLAAGLRLLLA